MEVDHRAGDDVPAWFLVTDYNDLCFHVTQAFFPRTGAWDNLKRALKAEYDETVWDHLSGAKSAPFEAGEHRQIVKAIASGDADAAGRAMFDHVMESKERTIENDLRRQARQQNATTHKTGKTTRADR